MLSFKSYFLQEARKNPDQNPKVPARERIATRLSDTTKKIAKSGYKNLFLSFTHINKLGINPTSPYDTPIGIYAYPADYIISKSSTRFDSLLKVDYATDSPIINMFEAKGNILIINKLTKSQFNALIAKLIKIYPEMTQWIQSSLDQSDVMARHSSFGGRFWYITMMLAHGLSEKKSKSRRVEFVDRWSGQERMIAKKAAVSWNTIFRKLGIDGFVDTGKGIIHRHEPIQAVFFSRRNVVNNEVIDNKWDNYNRVESEKFGQRVKDGQAVYDKMSESEIIDYINTISYAEWDILRDSFQHIRKQTEAIQLAYLKQGFKANDVLQMVNIWYEGLSAFKRPSPKVVDTLIEWTSKRNFSIQGYITILRDIDPKYLTERHIISIIDDIDARNDINEVAKEKDIFKTPLQIIFESLMKHQGFTDKVKLYIVKKEPRLIGLFDDPNESIQLAAITTSINGFTNPEFVAGIKNPTEKVQLAATQMHPHLIWGIKNPTEMTQLLAVDMKPSVISYIKKPTYKVQVKVLNSSEPEHLTKVKNLDPRIQEKLKEMGLL